MTGRETKQCLCGWFVRTNKTPSNETSVAAESDIRADNAEVGRYYTPAAGGFFRSGLGVEIHRDGLYGVATLSGVSNESNLRVALPRWQDFKDYSVDEAVPSIRRCYRTWYPQLF